MYNKLYIGHKCQVGNESRKNAVKFTRRNATVENSTTGQPQISTISPIIALMLIATLFRFPFYWGTFSVNHFMHNTYFIIFHPVSYNFHLL